MNLALYYQGADTYNSNLYAVDTGLAAETDTFLVNNAETDAWGHLTQTGGGQIAGRGLGISPNGTKLACAAVNGFTKEYKVQVWDIGSTPTVTGTLDLTLKVYQVSATKIKEFTKTALVTDTVTMPTWINDGNAATVNTQLLYGVLDLQVDNDGNVWWAEDERSSGNTTDTLNVDETSVPELAWAKVHVQQLLIGDSVPTDLTATKPYLIYSSASPSNGTLALTENPLRGAYCPGGFYANIICGLWDGARARIVGRSRTNLTNVPTYDLHTGDCPVIIPDMDNPIDQIYYVGGTAGSIIDNFEGTAQIGIFEPGDIVTQTITGTHYISGHTVSYSYLDQVPTVVFRDTDFTDVSSIIAPFVFETLPRAVRRTASYITFPYSFISDAVNDTQHLLVQTNDGTVAKWSSTDAATPADLCGRFTHLYSSSIFGVLLGTDRQFINDACWRVRAVTIGASSVAVSATDEVISPSNPDTIQDPDQDVSMRNAVANYHLTIADTDYEVAFPNSTVNA